MASIGVNSESEGLKLTSSQRFSVKTIDAEDELFVSRISVSKPDATDLLGWECHEDGAFSIWLRQVPRASNVKTDVTVHYSDRLGTRWGNLALPVYLTRNDASALTDGIELPIASQ